MNVQAASSPAPGLIIFVSVAGPPRNPPAVAALSHGQPSTVAEIVVSKKANRHMTSRIAFRGRLKRFALQDLTALLDHIQAVDFQVLKLIHLAAQPPDLD